MGKPASRALIGGFVAGGLGIPSSFFLSGALFLFGVPLVQRGKRINNHV